MHTIILSQSRVLIVFNNGFIIISLGTSRATPLSLSYSDILGVISICAQNRLITSAASSICVVSGCCEVYDEKVFC